ncbi:MAG: hypothetical protein IJD79_07555 [Clostridia bacterium]|nr:hypothetical protein [Clostridia bacterium]
MRKFILGTDWWTDCDDAVALRLLTRAHLAKEIELLGIVINACMEHSVRSVDGFLSLEGARGIPLGIDLDATDFGRNPPYQARLAPFAINYKSNSDAECGVKLYRRLLCEADGKVEIIEIGYMQVFAALLTSPPDEISDMSGIDLVREKVTRVWAMAGKWDKAGESENNFARNERAIRGGKIFVDKCPVPITFLGWEVGFDVLTGGNLSHTDHLWLALYDHGSDGGRCSWDPMLTLLALIGDAESAGYREVRGTARVDDEGRNYFTESDTGMHSYVIKARESSYYENIINEKII